MTSSSSNEVSRWESWVERFGGPVVWFLVLGFLGYAFSLMPPAAVEKGVVIGVLLGLGSR